MTKVQKKSQLATFLGNLVEGQKITAQIRAEQAKLTQTDLLYIELMKGEDMQNEAAYEMEGDHNND